MKPITKEEFDNHDCHASPEDGCQTCALWFEQQENQTSPVDHLTEVARGK